MKMLKRVFLIFLLALAVAPVVQGISHMVDQPQMTEDIVGKGDKGGPKGGGGTGDDGDGRSSVTPNHQSA